MKDRFIYKNTDGKLVLPTFVYKICAHFNLTGNCKPSDFAIMIVTRLAGKIDILNNDDVEFNSETIGYYEGLYNLIQKEGGLESCCTLSDYISGTENKEAVDELISAGIIIQEKVKVDENGGLLLCSQGSNSSLKENLIQVFNIIRNVKGYLIIPDKIYEVYKNFDDDNPYNFAKKIMNITTEKVPPSLYNTFNYFATIFKIIEQEGRCIILSDFCKKKGQKTTDVQFLTSMLNSKQAYMYKIEIDDSGYFKERILDEPVKLDETIYAQNRENKTQDFYMYIETERARIEAQINAVTVNIKILSEQDYKDLYEKFENLKSQIQVLYKKSRELAHSYENLLDFAENTNKQLIEEIEKSIKILNKEKINFKKSHKNDEHSIDYYEQIKKSIDDVETSLNKIMKDVKINNENDYITYNSKVTSLKDKLYEIFDTSLNSAYDDGSLTFSIIKEASTKHNNVMTKINESLEKLEELKNKVKFTNIFNT